MDAASVCIDCNWAYGSLVEFLALVVGSIGALLAVLDALLGGDPWVSPGGAAYNTADDIVTGAAQGGYGPPADPPAPAPTTTPPATEFPGGPPLTTTPPAGPTIGDQFFDIVGHDLLQLGRQ